MRISHLIFNPIQPLHQKFDKTNFRRGWSYIECPYWIKNIKIPIQPKTKDVKRLQYVVTVALHNGENELTHKDFRILNHS